MEWVAEHWFDLLSAVGIIGGLLFTAVSLRSETKTRRIENLLTLTENHRELWSRLFEDHNLDRVMDAAPDLSKRPLSREESIFVNLVIQHLNGAYEALKTGLTIKPEGLREDVGEFFLLPIPRMIWERIKGLQNDDFVEFVEECLVASGTKSKALRRRDSI